LVLYGDLTGVLIVSDLTVESTDNGSPAFTPNVGVDQLTVDRDDRWRPVFVPDHVVEHQNL
jgi:hypothetical protein